MGHTITVSRKLEDLGLLVGILLGLAYGLTEVYLNVYCAKFGCQSNGGFPIGFAIVVFALVLPKTLGRVTAGKLWEGVVNKWSGSVKSGS